MLYLKDTISVYAGIYHIAHTCFQQGHHLVFFGKTLLAQHELFFPLWEQ